MMQDNRSNGQALAGLFDTDMLMSDEFSRGKKERELLQAPTSLWEQMDERHGKLKSRFGLFGHLLGGGTVDDYGDADLVSQYTADKQAYGSQQKMQLLNQQFSGMDINNPTMAQVARFAEIDPDGLGKLAMENFAFNQRVGDLGRADGFRNDGIEDENDLWATEARLRHGKTANGQDTSFTETLAKARLTPEQFERYPAEAQETILYQNGSDEYRAAQDRIAGRKTLDQIELEGAAKGIGEASGAQTAEAVGFLPNAPQVAKDQEYAIRGAQGVIDLIKDGNIDTGKWINMVKDTFNVQTKADGTLGYQATQALIAQINSATFGALSEREIETLEKMFANGSYNEEANLGVMEGVMGKLNHEKEKHGRKTDEAIRRVQKFAPDEYEYFMQDDDNWLTYGDASKLPSSEGGKSFKDVWPMMQADGLSREEAVVGWRDELKKEKEASAEAAKRAEAGKKLAQEAMDEMTNWTSSFAGGNR